MRNKLMIVLAALVLSLALPLTASAELGLKPVADPWDDPNNLISDGGSYTVYNEDGYIVVWETPECDLSGNYMLLENGTALTVEYRVSYMEDIPWGHITVTSEDGVSFDGWVLMSGLLNADGKPAATAPLEIPAHPTVPDPTPTPAPSETPENPEVTPTPTVPVRPEQAISISNTYNSAIVYTSVAIAAAAIAFALIVLIKHKALNKKGE